MVEYPPAIRNKSHSKSSFPKIYSNIFNFQSPYRDKDKIQIPFWLPNHKITDIQLTLENETNRNIQIIAEVHLDLSRKLDDALKVENEKEMLLIRVNRPESEIRRIKQRIEEIAWYRTKKNKRCCLWVMRIYW